jgi:GNAT superfamily N-acetyltransferase
MRFVEGCGFEEFRMYLARIGLYEKKEDLEELREKIAAKRLNLIVWREDDEIIGHALWHESSTEEHRKGDPRDKEDRAILERLAGGKKDVVELHEVWLDEKQRGKGYGKKFFPFFEDYIRRRGYDAIVYYAYHPAAVAICRQRGYKEEYGLQLRGPKGEIETCYTFYLQLKKSY